MSGSGSSVMNLADLNLIIAGNGASAFHTKAAGPINRTSVNGTVNGVVR